MILPNKLWDDGSFECRTFCINTQESSFFCEFGYIDHLQLRFAIKTAMAKGARWLNVARFNLYTSDGEHILEIIWD